MEKDHTPPNPIHSIFMSQVRKKKKCVLVVDDDPMIVDLTCEFLAAEGYDTCSAGNTADALLEMQKQPVHAMLLDILLPDEDGLSFLLRFKKLYPDIPVVMLTGSGLMQTALQNGAAGFIHKDSELQNIGATMKRILN